MSSGHSRACLKVKTDMGKPPRTPKEFAPLRGLGALGGSLVHYLRNLARLCTSLVGRRLPPQNRSFMLYTCPCFYLSDKEQGSVNARFDKCQDQEFSYLQSGGCSPFPT